jgi:hypothetical protein
MTRLIFPDPCRSCGGILVPPEFLPHPTRVGADYVCLRCERPYRWVGDPPQLVTALNTAPAIDEGREP